MVWHEQFSRKFTTQGTPCDSKGRNMKKRRNYTNFLINLIPLITR